jgi:hypothetical protein
MAFLCLRVESVVLIVRKIIIGVDLGPRFVFIGLHSAATATALLVNVLPPILSADLVLVDAIHHGSCCAGVIGGDGDDKLCYPLDYPVMLGVCRSGQDGILARFEFQRPSWGRQ